MLVDVSLLKSQRGSMKCVATPNNVSLDPASGWRSVFAALAPEVGKAWGQSPWRGSASALSGFLRPDDLPFPLPARAWQGRT